MVRKREGAPISGTIKYNTQETFLSLLAVDRLSLGHYVAKTALPHVVGEIQAVLDRSCTLTGPYCVIGCFTSSNEQGVFLSGRVSTCAT